MEEDMVILLLFECVVHRRDGRADVRLHAYDHLPLVVVLWFTRRGSINPTVNRDEIQAIHIRFRGDGAVGDGSSVEQHPPSP